MAEASPTTSTFNTCNPRSTSMISNLRFEGISATPGKSSIFRKSRWHPTTKRTGPETRANALGEVSVVVIYWLPVFSRRRLGLEVSEPIQDLVGPEPLEPVQRLVQGRELLVRDAADLLHRLDVLLIQRIDDAADFLARRGQADADRAAIDARTLMIEEGELDQLLQIVGDVGAEVIAARAQLARGQFLVADIIEQQRLPRIDVGTAAAIEFILDDVEQAAMQPLHQSQRFKIERLHRSLSRSAFSGFHRRCNGFHHDHFPCCRFYRLIRRNFCPA